MHADPDEGRELYLQAVGAVILALDDAESGLTLLLEPGAGRRPPAADRAVVVALARVADAQLALRDVVLAAGVPDSRPAEP